MDRIVRNNYVELIQKMQVDDELCSYMVENRIFSLGNVDDIMSKTTGRGKAAEFLRLVTSRGERAKPVWIKALVATHQLDLADLVDERRSHDEERELFGSSTQPERASYGYPTRESSRPSKEDLTVNSPVAIATEQIHYPSPYVMETDVGTASNTPPVIFNTGKDSSVNVSAAGPFARPSQESGGPLQPAPGTVQVHEYLHAKIDLQIQKLPRNHDIIMNMHRGTNDCYHVRKTLPRAMAFIICNTNFVAEPSRPGGEIDLENLNDLLLALGCLVVIEMNLTAEEMKAKVRDWRSYTDFSEMDMCLICIMSHGETGSVSGVDDLPVSIERDIIRPFQPDQCPELQGKPKIVLVQACQGDRYTQGVRQSTRDVTEADGPSTQPSQPSSSPDTPQPALGGQFQIHPLQDFLVAYSTSPGYVSYREEYGAWFIRAFVIEMYNYSHVEHLADIMTRVTNAVSKFRTYSEYRDQDKCIQLPLYQSQLTKKLYLCVSEDQ